LGGGVIAPNQELCLNRFVWSSQTFTVWPVY